MTPTLPHPAPSARLVLVDAARPAGPADAGLGGRLDGCRSNDSGGSDDDGDAAALRVLLQVFRVAKLLLADGAAELADARVVDEVSPQVRAAGEAARAVRTLVAVHAAVQVLVATQAAHTEETLRAERARVRPLRSLKLAGSPRRRRLKWKPALVNHRGDRRPANQSLPMRTQTIQRNLKCNRALVDQSSRDQKASSF